MDDKIKYIIPFFIIFIIILLWHLTTSLIQDDLYFINTPLAFGTNEFILMRYNEWTSRILIEYVLITVLKLPLIIWQILDSIIFTGIGITIYKLLFNKEKNILYSSLISILILLFIYASYYALSSAGFITTTINYIWPLFSGLIAIYIIKNKIKILYPISILLLIFSTNNEQLCLIILGLTVIYLLLTKSKSKMLYIVLLISILAIINVLTCPGNTNRMMIELRWFPNYMNMTILNKIYIGVSYIINRCVTRCDVITMILLGLIGFINYKIGKYKFISFIPLFITCIFWILMLTNHLFLIDLMNANIIRYGYCPISFKRMILSLFIYLLFILTFLFSIIQIYKNKNKINMDNELKMIFSLWGIGFLSTILYGFTPSTPSLERMYIYFYFINMVVNILLIKNIIIPNIDLPKYKQINKHLI